MTYAIGLAVLVAMLAAVLVHRRHSAAHGARHRAKVHVPNPWTAWRQR